MKPYQQFGTAKYPLRPSALAWVGRCPVKSVLAMEEPEDGGGPAAQTGSLVHAAVAAFHLEPDASKRIAAAVATLQSAAGNFPKADPTEARLFTEAYICDPRNQNAKIIAVERRVSLTLEPHRLDPTGEPIVIHGTLDQIRDENGRFVVCDLKTGKPSGLEMIHDYAIQQAAYTLAARASGLGDVQPGYLIRNYGYRQRGAQLPSPDGVYWWLPFTVEGAIALLARVQLQVALIRSGEIDFGPASWCTYCEHRGLDSCMPKANAKLFSLPVIA